MNDPYEDVLGRLIRLGNRHHGYDPTFGQEDAADRRFVELNTAIEWRRSIAAEFGFEVGIPEHNPDDPPDCHVIVGGERLGVELMQLIDQEHMRRASKGETPYDGQLFSDMLWTKERFGAKLNQMVRQKGTKYDACGQLIDVLLIYTSERWLYPSEVQEWLADIDVAQYSSIRNVFLLFEYEPGGGVQHWPVFLIYGEMLLGSNDK